MSLVQIRTARERDLPVLQDIERAAGSWFAAIGMDQIAEDEPLPLAEPGWQLMTLIFRPLT